MKEISTPCAKCIDGIEKISVEGQETPEEITCRTCGGSGLISNLSLSDDLIDKVVDTKDKVDDIKEKVNEIFDKVNE